MSTEDKDILKFSGMMGHEFVGIVGEKGNRRLGCETNDAASSRRLCSDTDLIVYQRTAKGWRVAFNRNRVPTTGTPGPKSLASLFEI